MEAWSSDAYHDIFVSDLETLTREILANGQRPVLIVYPALYHAAMSAEETANFAPKLWDSQGFRPEMLLELERKHQALRRVAASTGAAIIDTQQQFDTVHGVARTALFIDAEHLSAPGNQKLAEILGESLAGLPGSLPNQRAASLAGSFAGR